MLNLSLSAFVGESDATGKRRIVTTILKDDFLEITFAMHADDAEKWAARLMEFAQEARGKSVIVPS